MKWFKRILAVKVSLVVAVLAVCLVSAYYKIKVKNVEVKYLKQQVEQSRKLNERLMGMEVKDLRSVKVTATSYNPTKAQCWKDGMITASGDLPTPGVIAISRDLEKKYGIKLGSKVVLEGFGVFTVSDYVHPRYKRRVDILSLVPKFSKKFGRRDNITLYYNKGE